MRRILYTIPNVDTAGSGKALRHIARGAARAGWEVHIMMEHTRGELAAECQSEFTVHTCAYITPMRPFSALFAGAWRVSRQFRIINPDVIHSFNYMSEYSEPMAAQLAGIPWIFTKKNMSWKGLAYNQWRLRSALAKAIVVQNTDMETQFYAGSKKTHRIPRGVDVAYFAQSRALANDVIHPVFDNQKRTILMVANLVPVKGVEDAIAAFAQTEAANRNWQLVIVGDTNLDKAYVSVLKEQIAGYELENHVHFTGKQYDVRPFLGKSELFVLPTRNEGRKEGSPVATLEAMAAGLVVLGSNVPGIKDQLESHPDVCFEAGNPRALAAVLKPLLSNTTEQNKELGNDFAKRCASSFSLNEEVHKHLSLYNKIARSIG